MTEKVFPMKAKGTGKLNARNDHEFFYKQHS